MQSSQTCTGVKRKKMCKCTLHDTVVEEHENPQVFNLETGKKVKMSTKESLIREKVIGPKCKYVCQKCVNHFEKHFSEKSSEDVEFVNIITNINDNKYSKAQMDSLAYALGLNIRNTQTAPNVKYGEILDDCDINKQILEYDSKLQNFLKALCQNTNDYKFLITLENLYSLTDNNFIGPLSFSKNLISYYITGSRTVVDLNNKLSPSGSYHTISCFLQETCNDKINIPNVDGVFFFDNNQILTKRWNIVYDFKASVSAVTTLLFIVPPTESNIQQNPLFCPYLWLTEFELVNYESDQKIMDDAFKSERNCFIAAVMEEVLQEQLIENGNVTDQVDTIKAGEFITKNQSKHKVATSTPEGGVSFKTLYDNPYSDVVSKIEGKSENYLMDPIFQNPCSFQAVSEVFDEIIDKNEGKREWIAMGCDGLPYILGSKLIENKYICSSCKMEFKSKKEFKNHIPIHDIDININNCKKYGRILLIPGMGHYEINYTKAIFKLMWTACLLTLAKLMGFRSPKALQSCEKALNHHKSWQLLNILLHGNAKELVLPYVRHCIMKKESPNVKSFFEYIQPCGANYIFLFKCTFTYLFALKKFRSGVRNCNHYVIKMSMDQMSNLFYGLNMSTYMEIDVRRRIVEKNCPKDLKSLYESLCCMSRSGQEGKAEGGDFILEAYNRKVKMFMPPGPATTKRWLRAYRNLPLLEKMKNNFGTQLFNDKTDYEGFRNTYNDTEILQWRKKIRSTHYLDSTDMHKSLDGQELDCDLINFDAKCRENRDRYSQEFPDHFKCEKVFITPSERDKFNDITSKTKKEIAERIEQGLLNIKDYEYSDVADNLSQSWKDIKKGKKVNTLNSIRR